MQGPLVKMLQGIRGYALSVPEAGTTFGYCPETSAQKHRKRFEAAHRVQSDGVGTTGQLVPVRVNRKFAQVNIEANSFQLESKMLCCPN
jgi:hypothetical protein